MKFKRIASVVLSVLLVVQALPYVSAHESSHWAYSSIERMTNLEIVKGNENDEFLPDNYITRAELFTILNRITAVSEMSGKSFPDVAPDAWYKNQTDIAVTDGYVAGYEDGTIRPDNFITRAETATVISRLFGAVEYDKSDFADSAKIQSWASDGISALTHMNVISGYEDGTFRPDDYITRAETVTILDKLIGKFKSDRQTVEGETFEGNMIITIGNVTFDNVTINGNVYITNAANSDEIRFINSTVNGDIFYGKKNNKAVVLENSNADSITVGGNDGKAVLTGTSNVDSIYVVGRTSLSSPDYLGEPVKNIFVSGDCTVGVDAETVIVKKSANVEIARDAKVSKLVVDSTATGADINTYGTLASINCNAACTLNGTDVQGGYKSSNIDNSDEKHSHSYTPSGGGGGGSGGGGGGGGGSSSSKPSSGATSGEVKNYEITGISFASDVEFSPAFDKETTNYKIDIDFDVDLLEMTVDFTKGAKVTINDENAESGKVFSISSIPSGESDITVSVFNGIKPLKTYTFSVKKGYASPEGTLEALNNLLKNTEDAEEDAAAILVAFGNAYIEGAVILLSSYYKAEYDVMSAEGDLTQRQFVTLVNKVNEENSELLSQVIGIKDADGYVYSSNVSVAESGMYNISVKYAATSVASGKKLAVYTDDTKYESGELELNSANGWVETEIAVPLIVGENALVMYAESEDDGNYGIIVSGITLVSEKLPVSAVTLEAENAKYYKTTSVTRLNGSSLLAGYLLKDNTTIGGGGVTFKFNSPRAQKVTMKLTFYRSQNGNHWMLAFLNPVATPTTFASSMVAGIDYPAVDTAIFSHATYTTKDTPVVCEMEIDAVKGENTIWIPARNLLYINDDRTAMIYMYHRDLNDEESYANRQTEVDKVELTPADYNLIIE